VEGVEFARPSWDGVEGFPWSTTIRNTSGAVPSRANTLIAYNLQIYSYLGNVDGL
jgi:hypothetical protein